MDAWREVIRPPKKSNARSGAMKNQLTEKNDDIVWLDGAPRFRGFPVEQREVKVAGMSLSIASMRDATHQS